LIKPRDFRISLEKLFDQAKRLETFRLSQEILPSSRNSSDDAKNDFRDAPNDFGNLKSDFGHL
jgi:hypothetical protein